MAGNLTLDQWKDQLQQLLEQKDPQCADEQSAGVPNQEQSAVERYLPYLPTIAESEEQEKRISSQLAGAREEYAGAVERVKQAFQNFRPAYEVDEDLAAAERTFAELEKNRSALEIALDTLEKLSRQQQEVLAPQLNSAVERASSAYVEIAMKRSRSIPISRSGCGRWIAPSFAWPSI